MAAIELFNHTKYPDEVLLDALKYAKRKMKVAGDVAVKVMYYANSTGTVGSEYNMVPYIKELAGGLKKFDGRSYKVIATSRIAKPREIEIATKKALRGWVLIRLPRPSKNLAPRYANGSAVHDLDTMLEEMGHVWQDRNMETKPNGWNSRKLSHDDRPCEVHVRKLVEDAKPKTTADRKRRKEVVDAIAQMYLDTEPPAPRKKSAPKTNRYGEKLSDYRNMKIGRRFRGGDKVVECPCCGEGAVWLDRENGYKEEQVYTHVAAYEYRRFEGTVRYTWNGCKLDENGDRFARVEELHTIWER